MNNYKNEAGYHTPEQSARVIAELRERFPKYNFIDTSWHNDGADSFEIENIKTTTPDHEGKQVEVNKYRVWMSNAEEEILHFSIEERPARGEGEDIFTDFPTVEDLIQGLAAIEPDYMKD